MAAEAAIPLRSGQPEPAQSGLLVRGKLMRVVEVTKAKRDGTPFTVDVVTVYGRGGQISIECGRNRDGSQAALVAKLAGQAPPEGSDELGDIVELPVYIASSVTPSGEARTYVKLSTPREARA